MSPTKTPEYLAGGKPVVSTPIPDVEKQYGDIISIESDPDRFALACQSAAQNSQTNSQAVSEKVRKQSWEQIAKKMMDKIENTN